MSSLTLTNEQIAMMQASVFLASKKRVSVEDVVTNYETCLTILTTAQWHQSDIVINQDEDDPVS